MHIALIAAANAILLPLVMAGIYYFIWLLWKYVPEGRAKRILFKSWGPDNGPWMKYKVSGKVRTPPKEPESLLEYLSQVADPKRQPEQQRRPGRH